MPYDDVKKLLDAKILRKEVGLFIDLETIDTESPIEEYPPDVYKTYFEMVENDTTIGGLLEVIKAYLSPKFTSWYLDNNDTEAGQFITDVLFNKMTPSLENLITTAAEVVIYGMYPFEKVFDFDKESKKIYLKKLAPKNPSAITEFKFDDKPPYNLSEIVFEGKKGDSVEEFSLPLKKMLIFTYEDDGGIVNGRSILRRAYKLYKLKKFILRAMALHVAKHAIGVPYAQYKGRLSSTNETNLKNALSRIGIDESGYIIFPDNITEKGFLGGESRAYPFVEFLKYINTEIYKIALAQFLGIGIDVSGGSYNLGAVMEKAFFAKIWQIGDMIAEKINKEIINPLVEYNFGKVDKKPKLSIKQVGTLDNNMFFKNLGWLLQNKAITIDTNLENEIRARAGFKPISEEERDRILIKQIQIQQQARMGNVQAVPSKNVNVEPQNPEQQQEQVVAQSEEVDMEESKKKEYTDEEVFAMFEKRFSEVWEENVGTDIPPELPANYKEYILKMKKDRANEEEFDEWIAAVVIAAERMAEVESLKVGKRASSLVWRTAGDEKVCPLCAKMEGLRLSEEVALQIFKPHNHCRCRLEPSNEPPQITKIEDLQLSEAELKNWQYKDY